MNPENKDGPDLESLKLLEAAERAAGEFGKSLREIFDEGFGILRSEHYPTRACLLPSEIRRLRSDTPLKADRSEHLRSCPYCSKLAAWRPVVPPLDPTVQISEFSAWISQEAAPVRPLVEWLRGMNLSDKFTNGADAVLTSLAAWPAKHLELARRLSAVIAQDLAFRDADSDFGLAENALKIAANLPAEPGLFQALRAVLKQKVLLASWNASGAISKLYSALAAQQVDDSLAPFWLELIGGEGQPAGTNMESDASLHAAQNGILKMPGAWPHIGAVLKSLAQRIELSAKNPNRRRLLFTDFLDRALELSPAANRDSELHAAAMANDWPQWAALCLKVAAPKSPNIWSVWWPVAILIDAQQTGVRTVKSGMFYEMRAESSARLVEIRDILESRRAEWVYGSERACLSQVANIFEEMADSRPATWERKALKQASLSISQEIGVGAELVSVP